MDISSFDHMEIAGYIGNMTSREVPALAAAPQFKRELSQRDKFLVRSALMLTALGGQIILHPLAEKFQVSPKAMASTWDDVPENIKEFQRIGIRFALEVCGEPLPDDEETVIEA